MISFHVATMKEKVVEFAEKLRNLGYSVWICLDIAGGDAFRDSIVTNVVKCSVFLPFINEGWAKSKECLWECNIAQRRALVTGAPVILPIYIGGFSWMEKYPLVYGMSCNTNGLALQNDDWDDVFAKLLTSLQVHITRPAIYALTNNNNANVGHLPQQIQAVPSPLSSPSPSLSPSPSSPSPSKFSFESKNAEEWNVDDVCTWLSSINLSEHVPAFRENDVDGDMLLTFHTTHFEDLGVKNSIQQHKIKQKLSKYVSK